MSRRFFVAALVSSACHSAPTPAPQPPSASTAPIPAAAQVVPTLQPDRPKHLDAIVIEYGVARLATWSRYAPEGLAAVGLDEPALISVVEGIRRMCGRDCADEALKEVHALAIVLLRDIGTRASFDYLEEREVNLVLQTEMGATLGPCTPPDGEAQRDAETELADFFVLDRRRPGATELSARALAPQERRDLAYFMASVREAGPAVSDVSEPGPASGQSVTPRDQKRRKELVEEAEAARELGDRTRLRTLLHRYLVSLGFPGPIRESDEGARAWGGARFSFVLRELAWLSELEGRYADAAQMYRRADPGGGMCGTSYDSYREDQILGLIRATERSLGCAPIVPERLMDWNGADYTEEQMGSKQRARQGYGTERLAAAGYDIERLYRGALLTRNRNTDLPQLRAAFLTLPRRDQQRAVARLDRRGPEAWEARVHAIEGLVETLGRDAPKPVFALLPLVDSDTRQRAIVAVGELSARHVMGPCDPDDHSAWGAGGSNVWHRRVPAFGTSCALAYDDAEADTVAQALARYARSSREPEVRTAAIDALGNVFSPHAKELLQRERRRAGRALARCRAAKAKSDACEQLSWLTSDIDSALEVYVTQ